MKDYLITIVITSIAIGFYNVLTPKHNGIDKLVKLIGMLVILLTVISPLASFIDKLDDGVLDSLKDDLSVPKEDYKDDYDLILQEYLNSYSISSAEESIKQILYNEFSISKEECEVRIFTHNESGSVGIEKIQILLSGASIFKNPYNIEDFIGRKFSCESQVLIKRRG